MDFEKARFNMVEQQIRPWEVLDQRVLDLLFKVKREDFVPAECRALAFVDTELPLPNGGKMLQPKLEARIVQDLSIRSTDRILEIGTGSGYLTACLARLSREVVSIERHADLAEAARARLDAQGVINAGVIAVDAFGWEPQRRFDAICLTGAVASIPPQFIDWLVPGGRVFIIHGHSPSMEAAIVTRGVNGLHSESLFETDVPYLAGAAPVPVFAL